jgi:hypothetical protein
MNRTKVMTARLLVVFCVSLLTGAAAELKAQHFTCWQCILNQGSHTYSCVYGGGFGWSSCTYTGGQGCNVGSLCGFYLTLPDGTTELPSVGQNAVKERRVTRGALTSVASDSREIDRGCDGAVVERRYGARAAVGLRKSSRRILV